MLKEKRRYRRYATRLPIVSSDDEGLNFSFLSDLSRSGAYLETEKLLPVEARFSFVLTNGKLKSPVVACVRRIRDAFFHGGRSGMGITFERLDAAGKAIRDDILLYQMAYGHHEPWQLRQ